MAGKKQSQLQFKALKDYTRTKHGGGLRTGARKLARPLSTKSPMHLVLRSSQATGTRSMLRKTHFPHVTAIVFKFAKRNDVHIAQFANVGNHLHLLVQAKTRTGFQNFLRTIAGLIARLITGAVKGRPNGRFWDELAFSRAVSWGLDYQTTVKYVFENAKEAFGVSTARKPRTAEFEACLYGFS